MSLLYFIISSIMLNCVYTATPQLIKQDFNDQIFSNPSDWQVTFGIVGYTNVNSQTIFGGVGKFGVSTQIQKIFTMPPHYLIRVEITIWTFGQWNNGEIKLLCDERLMSSKKLYTMQNAYHSSPTKINVIQYHNSGTAIIQIRPSIQDLYTQAWGIRDFQIYYYPCPNGCQICSNTDTQSSDCNQWILNYQQFIDTSINKLHNEGWFINDDKINFKFDQFNGIPIFGYYNAGQTLKRTFYLEVHDRIRIQFLFIKLNNWDNQISQLFIDDILQLEIRDKTDELHNINYCDSDPGLDSIQRIDIDILHTNQLTTFQFTTTLSMLKLMNKFGIRDFTIFTLCQACLIPTPTTSITYFTETSFLNTYTWIMKNKNEDPGLYNCSKVAKSDPNNPAGEFTLLGRFTKSDHILRTLTLKPHRELKLTMNIFLIDSFDNEIVYVYIDDIKKAQFTRGPLVQSGTQICGTDFYGDTIEYFEYISSHTADKIKVDIYSTLDENVDNEFFSMGDFNIRLGDCPFDCDSCNNISGHYCELKWWDEYLSLTRPYFKDTQGWGPLSTKEPIKITQCSNGLALYGGYGSVIHSTSLQLFQNLDKSHNKLRIKLNLYIIGTWTQGVMQITVDDQIFYSKAITSSHTSFFCSTQNIQAFIIQIDKVVDHTSNLVAIKIQNDLPIFPEDDRSFGIRDFYIQYLLI